MKNWITSGNGKVDYLCDENFNLNLNYVFPVFPIDCSIIREFLDGGIRGYEGVMNVNGHSYNDSKLSSNNTNFALLVSHHFEEPFKKPNEYAIKVSSMANQLSCGSVIVQKYGDIKLGRRSTKKRIDEGFVRPTLKEAVPGDLALALPYKSMRSIIEMIEVLD